MAFTWWRGRKAAPKLPRHPGPAPQLPREDRSEVRRQWSLRFEEVLRLALADLADELAAARAAGFRPLTLGPRVLRTETAALTAITALQCRFGDLA